MSRKVIDGLPWFFDRGTPEVYLSAKASFLVLDFEATRWKGNGAIDPASELIIGCYEIHRPSHQTEYKTIWGGEYEMGELVRDIGSVDFVVAHNAKYELQWLKRCGMELRDVLVYCTMLGQWVLDGNERLPRNLDGLAQRYKLGRKIDLIAKLWDTGTETYDIPRSWLEEYCKLDVALCRQLFLKQREQLAERDQLHLAWARNVVTACLADIEFAGMTLDKERVDDEFRRISEELERTSEELQRIADGRNLGSSKQLSELLFSVLEFTPPKDQRGKPRLTPKGAVATDAAAIESLVATTDEQRQFLALYKRWNKLDSLLTKNLDFFVKICEERGGVFHGAFNQNVTQTHRLSSSGRPVKFKGAKKAKGVTNCALVA